jgi:hypothetical protein
MGRCIMQESQAADLINRHTEQGVRFDTVTSIQNGLKDESLIKQFGPNRVLGYVVDEAARIFEPGNI